jgi:toxin ParE1/3/4
LSFQVRVRRAAELDISEAQAWYETQQSGLGVRFYGEVMQVLDRFDGAPLIYPVVHPVVHRDVHRAVVRKFPFLVWYRVLDQTVQVLAVTHAKQHPTKPFSRLQ